MPLLWSVSNDGATGLTLLGLKELNLESHDKGVTFLQRHAQESFRNVRCSYNVSVIATLDLDNAAEV